jgi:hypothetical protein
MRCPSAMRLPPGTRRPIVTRDAPPALDIARLRCAACHQHSTCPQHAGHYDTPPAHGFATRHSPAHPSARRSRVRDIPLTHNVPPVRAIFESTTHQCRSRRRPSARRSPNRDTPHVSAPPAQPLLCTPQLPPACPHSRSCAYTSASCAACRRASYDPRARTYPPARLVDGASAGPRSARCVPAAHRVGDSHCGRRTAIIDHDFAESVCRAGNGGRRGGPDITHTCSCYARRQPTKSELIEYD